MVPMLNLEGVVLEIQAFDRGIGRYRVDALFAPGPEQLECRIAVHFRVVEFRDRRRRHQIAAVDQDRIVVGGVDAAEARDVLVELDVHHAVFLERMHLAGFGFALLDPAQRFRNRHLIDQDLSLGQRRFGDAVAGLDHAGLGRLFGRRHTGRAGEKLADADGVRRVVGALVDDLQHVVRSDHRGRHLDAAGPPAVGQGHFAAAERHLIAGYGDRLEDGAADRAFHLLVQIGEIVPRKRGRRGGAVHVHQAASSSSRASAARRAASARRWRTVPSSPWKST